MYVKINFHIILNCLINSSTSWIWMCRWFSDPRYGMHITACQAMELSSTCLTYSLELTCPPTMPSLSRGMSVCDQLLRDHGSTVLRLSFSFSCSSWLWMKLRMFHGRSLCLHDGDTIIASLSTCQHGPSVAQRPVE